MKRLLVALFVVLSAPAAAQAQVPVPSLTADLAFAPPTGIARGDFIAGTITDIPAAVAVDGDRIYTVGRTQGGTGGADIGIIARRVDGSLDPTFSDDGKLIIALAPGTESDIGTGIVVLPDGRLRVVAATDVVAGSSESLDIALVGLNFNGTPDTTFGAVDVGTGARTGRIIFPAGPANDVPARLVLGPTGRLAIVGSRSNGSRDDVFVSLREPDGSPVSGFGTAGVRVLDRGGVVSGVAMVDRGVDVEFRGDGLLALVLVETDPSSGFNYIAALHAFDGVGADDPTFSDDADLVLEVGQPDTVPGGIVASEGRFYVTGYTRAGADTNAFLARVDAGGGGFETRSFDMRGKVVPAGQAVVSRALDLAVVPGTPPALVAAGSVDWLSDTGSTTTDWAAAAFNGFEGPLAQAGFGDVVLQAPGQGGLLSVAPGASGWAAVTGTQIDTATADNSYGNARLQIDADKRCDLALTIAEPAEIVFRGGAPAALSATITNRGTRPCAGTLGGSGQYRLDAFSTGLVGPNESVTATAIPVRYDGPRRAEDFMRVAVSAPGDADDSNNAALVHLVFRYCDLSVAPDGAVALLPSEGTRLFPVTLRNTGTVSCRVRIGSRAAYTLDAGKRVSDEVPGAAPARARVGARVAAALRAGADDDVDLANNVTSVSSTVVGVGDSDVRRTGRSVLSGVAARGRGAKLKASSLRVSRVEVAVLRRGSKTCGWLTSAQGEFSSRKPDAGGECGSPRWLRARGTAAWRFELSRALSSGRYRVFSRAWIGAGFPEARFTAGDRNRVDFRIR